ncbi:hypothetical protein EDD75_1273 [Thermodesulfitimonas autotrophica]|uniref:Uncharacterized protein n=1 Tax=Thermodesulfitimonas autotrophica TaxID=1894989 RepID=A0A3N5AP57_9THEO|nr:hypothetical protein EDD75_1273 [Thermodesulfitimonas autotrophica]
MSRRFILCFGHLQCYFLVKIFQKGYFSDYLETKNCFIVGSQAGTLIILSKYLLKGMFATKGLNW